MADQPDRRRWHVKKEVSLGDLVAIVVASCSVIYAYSTLNSRVLVLEAHVTQQRLLDDRQDADAVRYQARIDASLAEINRKLDYILEHRR